MSLSPEQIAANRKSAVNLALTQTALDGKAKVDWTYDERTLYNKTLAGIIAANPTSFAAQDVATAKQVERADYSPLASADFSFSDFGSAVADNANDLVGKPLVNLGKSVSGAFNFLGVAGPWLAVGGLLFVSYMFVKAKGKAVSQ